MKREIQEKCPTCNKTIKNVELCDNCHKEIKEDCGIDVNQNTIRNYSEDCGYAYFHFCSVICLINYVEDNGQECFEKEDGEI